MFCDIDVLGMKWIMN